MRSKSQLIYYFLLLFYNFSHAVDFIGKPTEHVTNPQVNIDIGEQALNTFLNNATEMSVSFTTQSLVDARTQVLFGINPYAITAQLTKLVLDFEDGSAGLNMRLDVRYDLAGSVQSVSIPYSSQITLSDVSYDIGSTRIALAINKLNQWHDFLNSQFGYLPSYVRSLLTENISNLYIINRDWLLSQLQPEFGLPEAPVFWEDPELTVGFAFEDDYLRLFAVPHIESEEPKIELWGRKGSSGLNFMLVANAQYMVEDLRVFSPNGSTILGPQSMEMSHSRSRGHDRYYANFTLKYDDGWSWSETNYVRAHFHNGRQLVTMLWKGNKSGYSQDKWQLYGYFGTPTVPDTTD